MARFARGFIERLAELALLKADYTKRFKKDFTLMKKRQKNTSKLIKVMDMFITEIPLPIQYRNHPLQGIYKGAWECHIEADWLLIYRIDETNRRIIFYRTGSHSDLF